MVNANTATGSPITPVAINTQFHELRRSANGQAANAPAFAHRNSAAPRINEAPLPRKGPSWKRPKASERCRNGKASRIIENEAGCSVASPMPSPIRGSSSSMYLRAKPQAASITDHTRMPPDTSARRFTPSAKCPATMANAPYNTENDSPSSALACRSEIPNSSLMGPMTKERIERSMEESSPASVSTVTRYQSWRCAAVLSTVTAVPSSPKAPAFTMLGAHTPRMHILPGRSYGIDVHGHLDKSGLVSCQRPAQELEQLLGSLRAQANSPEILSQPAKIRIVQL